MKVAPNFWIQEFVPPVIFNLFGEKSIWFIRPEIITLAQYYREYFGKPVTVNNWVDGGKYDERGFRPPNAEGAELSQHKLGAAFDCSIEGFSADEVREAILKKPKDFMSLGLTTLEDGAFAPTWVHSDIRTTGLDHILIVKP